MVDDPTSELDGILSRYDKADFSEGIGTFKYFNAHIHVKSDAVPLFKKARPVPYAMKAAVEELVNLEKQGIIKKIDSAEWAAPTVNVLKKDGVRICGDYKVSVNPYVEIDPYPLLTAQDLFASLAGGKVLTMLDLRQAYHHLELEDESKQYLIGHKQLQGLLLI